MSIAFCFLNKLNGGFNYGRNKSIINKLLQKRRNEKYKGDVLQGKTYTTDPITHKRVINMGEENQYNITQR